MKNFNIYHLLVAMCLVLFAFFGAAKSYAAPVQSEVASVVKVAPQKTLEAAMADSRRFRLGVGIAGGLYGGLIGGVIAASTGASLPLVGAVSIAGAIVYGAALYGGATAGIELAMLASKKELF